MFDKIDISSIIKDHFKTLINFRTEKLNKPDLVGFLLLPIIGAFLLVFFGLKLKTISSILITSLSIFAALLFNLLMLVFDLINKEKPEPKNSKKRDQDLEVYEVSKELFTNISYSIITSIVTIVFLLLGYLSNNMYYHYIIDFTAFFLVGNFLFTLFMVLKRTHTILTFEFKTKKQEYEEKYGNIE